MTIPKRDRPTCPKCGHSVAIDGYRKKDGAPKWRCSSKKCRHHFMSEVIRDNHGVAPPCRRCGSDNTVWNGGRPLVDGGYRHSVLCNDCGANLSTDKAQEVVAGELPCNAKPESQRLVITSAQNQTAVDRGFWQALQTYCTEENAQLLVIPYRYKNVSLARPQAEVERSDVWASEVVSYLVSSRYALGEHVQLMADISIQPTATKPLSGIHRLTGHASGIFGHPKVALECKPTPGQALPKVAVTTGACTVPNYSNTKAGKKGEFDHSIGALVVEHDGGALQMRHLRANKDGSFYDLDCKYTGAGKTTGHRPASFTMGDLHAARHDPANLEACLSLMRSLRPRKTILHDALDFQSGSHHNGYFDLVTLHALGKHDVAAELDTTAEIMDRITALGDVYVVDSNHNGHLIQWLEDERNARDIHNAEIYHELKSWTITEIKKQANAGKMPYVDPFAHAMRQRMQKAPTFVRPGDSLQIQGVEHGFHGHRGPNGARGSAVSFDQVGVKTTIGHSHTPRIEGGCFQVGTSSLLNMGYNADSPSSWMHAHCLLYPNGRRSLIFVVDGKTGI